MPTNKKRKQGRQGQPQPAAASTHKDRAVWFHERSTFPLRDAPPAELEKSWAWLAAAEKSYQAEWEQVGPLNIAGRVTCLVVHPDHPETMYAGSAAGGVWRTTNWGETWEPRWKRFISQNIGALAIAQYDHTQLIAATGEANLSADTYPGSGLYRTNSEGEDWNDLFTTPDGKPIPDDLRKFIPRRVGALAFDPSQTLIGAIGSVSMDERMQAGLYLVDATNGMIPCAAFPLRSYNCHSVHFHPKIPNIVFAGLELRGSQNGIWRSMDSGKTWNQQKKGLARGEEFGRTSLAIAPGRPDTIYALAADRKTQVLGLFRSDDRGEKWRAVVQHSDVPDERFMSYNNTIAVHPEDPDIVIWGGQDLYKTTSSKNSARTIRISQHKFRGLPNYVHEDHHAIVMPRGNLVYSGNDGGVAVSEDGGKTWISRSRGMVTTMFYDIDVAPTNCRFVAGGAQDTGTLIGGTEGDPGEFVQALSGDGGWIVFDGADEQHAFGSYQNLHIFRHKRGQAWRSPAWTDVSPKNIAPGENLQRAIAVLAIEPGNQKGVKKLWAGTARIWQSANDGRNWKPISDVFDGSVISAIEVAPANPNVIYVGTTRGGFYRTVDGGKTWSQDLSWLDIPPRLITRIESHPRSAKTIVITVASTGLPGVSLTPPDATPYSNSTGPLPAALPAQEAKRAPSFDKRYSNVFRSNDMGETWEDLDGGALPNVVFYAAAYQTRKPYNLFVAGDVGVFALIPNGWQSISGNLPNVVVSDLVYHHADEFLFAGTYGRGIWKLSTKGLALAK